MLKFPYSSKEAEDLNKEMDFYDKSMSIGVLKVNKVFLLIILPFVILTGCSYETTTKTFWDEIVSVIPGSIQLDKIYHLEIVKDEVLVFYKSNNGIDAGFVQKNSNEWEWIMGGGSVSPEEEFDWVVTNDENIPLTYIYGVVNNPDIEKVVSKKPNGEKEKIAKIVTVGDEGRIWFTFYEEPVNAPIDFIGLNGDGNQVIKD